MNRGGIFLPVLLVILGATTLDAQTLPLQLQLPQSSNDLVVDGRPLGDVDGDGRCELAIVLRRTLAGPLFENRVDIISGASGAVLMTLGPFGVTSAEFSDVDVLDAGDVNADGFDDVLLANENDPGNGAGASASSYVRVYSGFDASVIHQWQPSGSPAVGYGAVIRGGKDVDDDGVAEVLIVRRLAVGAAVEVRSGANGSLLQSFPVVSGNLMSAEWADDGDDDGFPEILVSVYENPAQVGQVRIFHGMTGFWVGTLMGQGPQDFYGRRLTNLGDVDGDGRDDMLIVADERNGTLTGAGWLGVHDAFGQLLYSRITLGTGAYSQDRFNPAGDINGDGVNDFTARYQVRDSLTQVLIEFSRRVFSGADGAILEDLPIRATIIGDVSGDEIADYVWQESPSGGSGTPTVTVGSIMGANSYGNPAGPLTLSWDPRDGAPQRGDIAVDGATPGASLLVAASLAPVNAIIGGTTFPLYVSPLASDLIVTANLSADASGRVRIFENLAEPILFGLSIYIQFAELSPNPTTSNGLEVLFGR